MKLHRCDTAEPQTSRGPGGGNGVLTFKHRRPPPCDPVARYLLIVIAVRVAPALLRAMATCRGSVPQLNAPVCGSPPVGVSVPITCPVAVTLATSRASARVLVAASMRRARRVGRYSAVGIVTVSVCAAVVAAAAAPTGWRVVVADDVWKREVARDHPQFSHRPESAAGRRLPVEGPRRRRQLGRQLVPRAALVVGGLQREVPDAFVVTRAPADRYDGAGRERTSGGRRCDGHGRRGVADARVGTDGAKAGVNVHAKSFVDPCSLSPMRALSVETNGRSARRQPPSVIHPPSGITRWSPSRNR